MQTGERQKAASIWFGVLAVLVLLALVTELVMAVTATTAPVAGEPLASTPVRVLRYFSFFTIQSNILVAVATVGLALDPTRDGRVWRVIRLAGLLGITVTGIVYVVALRGLIELDGMRLVNDYIFHYICPAASVAGWVMFGPRPRIDAATMRAALMWPALYIGYTVIHGAISDWYPYPFIDVVDLGYLTVIRNGILVIVLMAVVGMVYRWGDRSLTPVGNRGSEPT